MLTFLHVRASVHGRACECVHRAITKLKDEVNYHGETDARGANGDERKRNPGSMTTTIQDLSCFSTSSCPIIHHNERRLYIWNHFCTCIVAQVRTTALPRTPQISISYNLSPPANKVMLQGSTCSTVPYKRHHKRIPSPQLSYSGLSTSACSVMTEVGGLPARLKKIFTI